MNRSDERDHATARRCVLILTNLGVSCHKSGTAIVCSNPYDVLRLLRDGVEPNNTILEYSTNPHFDDTTGKVVE